MAGKVSDRKPKKLAQAQEEEAIEFSLPTSLPCSEINYPIRLQRKFKANWQEILDEGDKFMKDIEDTKLLSQPAIIKAPFKDTACDFISNEVFPYLLPALEQSLCKAEVWNALKTQTCFYNGIDHIAQELWKNNPRFPSRKFHDDHIFNMPWVREYLKENPRPLYPKSWLWSEDYAATVIQKTVRQYFVQRTDEVQEMRSFWKKLKYEKEHPSIDENPFLARYLAKHAPAPFNKQTTKQ
ncbi:IQ domain-containing protein K [Plutella xylostella]|uniref:IQ domain-containing protein K n=1 Tax=Plutella xylostella TaxID=51655 RepID=UPI002032A245|nr:IQ domain-containing protein K [Plutella xylostella]